MAKVIFSIQYEINSNKREEYFDLIKELKNLIKYEGLESYEIYEVKGKPNCFQEIYSFSNEEAYENFDDDQTERLNILINKLADLTIDSSSKYTTLFQLSNI